MNYSANHNRQRVNKSGNVNRFFNSASVKYSAFLAFLTIVLFTGGASRPDVTSLLILRPAAFLFLGYACLVITRQQFDLVRAPFILLSCLAALMLLQLIPLPPSIWSSLPQRDVIYEVSKDLGLQDLWRPISLVPSRTLNSLMSLSVPAAAMMLFAILDDNARRKVPLVIIVMGVASMLLGLLQVAGPIDGLLYTYAITNNGVMVGFFANRNHHAVFLACMIPIATGVLFDRISSKRGRKIDQNFLHIALTISLMVFVLSYVLVTGSRSGTLLAFVGLLIAAMLWALWLMLQSSHSADAGSVNGNAITRRIALRKNVKFVPIVLVIILLGLAAAIYSDRDFALIRYQQLNDVEELREKTYPVLVQMAKTHFSIGTGFGSFEWLYKMWEPDDLLTTSYLNQAHNDGLQWVIEGGIPALAILVSLFWMMYRRGFELVRKLRNNSRVYFVSIAAFFVVLICVAASLADYPLRTPIMMVLFTFAICQFQMRMHPNKT